MKKITFTNPAVTKQRSKKEVIDLIVDFLHQNGMNHTIAQEWVGHDNDGSGITIKPKCSNSQFTRALALFQLIFSEPSREDREKNKGLHVTRSGDMIPPGYIRYDLNGMTLVPSLVGDGIWTMIYNHISSHMNILIEY